ncbi:hypothetical protein ACFYOY_13555 [Streptomyces sp. NPDC007875]|uniref:hypothetical protein n=1 Tax=Streptomyces sp. NPDC007875 TaxID=3364783 RepID=UPI003693C85A
MTRRPITLAALTVIAAAALTACGHSQIPVATPQPATTAPVVDVTADSDTTAAIVDIVWADTAESDRDALCDGIAMFGVDWAAQQLAEGAGDDSLDWDMAAQLVEGKCDER